MKILRIATRKSPLALWQAEHVRGRLLQYHPDLNIELVKLSTQGDRILDTPLAKIGGKGLFIKELEQGLLERSSDIAVHSTKDMPVELPTGLHIGAICEREDPRDAFVSQRYPNLSALPKGARLGTSSLRRQCQIRAAFPQLQVIELRGNVNTRLKKLDSGEYDAVLLAAAGLKRLGMEDRITGYLDTETSLPAVGQGAVCIECRADDVEINRLLQPLKHDPTTLCVSAERAMNERLQGGCQVPIGGYARLLADTLTMDGLVGRPDGSQIIRAAVSGPAQQAPELGQQLADQLLAKGAKAILDSIYSHA